MMLVEMEKRHLGFFKHRLSLNLFRFTLLDLACRSVEEARIRFLVWQQDLVEMTQNIKKTFNCIFNCCLFTPRNSQKNLTKIEFLDMGFGVNLNEIVDLFIIKFLERLKEAPVERLKGVSCLN